MLNIYILSHNILQYLLQKKKLSKLNNDNKEQRQKKQKTLYKCLSETKIKLNLVDTIIRIFRISSTTLTYIFKTVSTHFLFYNDEIIKKIL